MFKMNMETCNINFNIYSNLTVYGYWGREEEEILEYVLPEDETLQSLPDYQREYLAFTTYILQNALSQSTLIPKQVIHIVDANLGRVHEITPENYWSFRKDFIQFSFALSRTAEKFAIPSDPLFQELYLRTGEDRLRELESYQKWSQGMVFEGIPEYLREEYRRALWVETQISREISGLTFALPGVSKFILGSGMYSAEENSITAQIDLCKRNTMARTPPFQINQPLRSEVGHYLFQLFSVGPAQILSELDDRISMFAYSEEVEDPQVWDRYRRIYQETFQLGNEGNEFASYLAGERVLAAKARAEIQDLPLDVRTFFEGGVWLNLDWMPYPTTSISPRINLSLEELNDLISWEKHCIGEWIELLIRKKVISLAMRGEIEPGNLRKAIYWIGIQAQVSILEGRDFNSVVAEIYNLDQQGINKIFATDFIFRLIPLLTRYLSASHEEHRLQAAVALAKLGVDNEQIREILSMGLALGDARLRAWAADTLVKLDNSLDENEQKQLRAYVLIAGEKWQELAELGGAALPALYASLMDRDFTIRKKASELLLETGQMEDPTEILQLQLNLLVEADIDDPKWETIKNYGLEAVPFLENLLDIEKEAIVKRKTAEILIDILNLDPESDRYRELQAYTYLGMRAFRSVGELGELARPVLETALEDSDFVIRAKAIEALAEMGASNNDILSRISFRLIHATEPMERQSARRALEQLGSPYFVF